MTKCGFKLRVQLEQTDEYERLVRFFAQNGLEFDGEEEVDTDIVRCYKMTVLNDFLVGGVVIAKREGRFIIDGIAVSEEQRLGGLGAILLKKAVQAVRELGGNELYLVARAPGFFRKHGFVSIPAEEAPNFFECKQCPQYLDTCNPEIMKLVIT